MRAVYKYKMPDPGMAWSVEMPNGAIPLTVQEQGCNGYLWALVDTEAPTVTRTFRTYATGEAVADGDEYVGTWFLGGFVWHVFEEVPAEWESYQ